MNKIKDQIIVDFTLMPDYHIEIFGEASYEKMLTKSNWKQVFDSQYENDEEITTFVYAEPDLSVTAYCHHDSQTIYDIQYLIPRTAKYF